MHKSDAPTDENRRIEVRPTLGISTEFESSLDDLSQSDPKMYRLFRLFWRDMSSYAIDNGYRLDRSYKTIRRLSTFLAIGAVFIALFMVALGIVTIISLGEDSRNGTRIAQQAKTTALQAKELATAQQKLIQMSRYDNAYRSCVSSDMRNAEALATVIANHENSPFIIALINEVVVQRGTPNSNPTDLSSSQEQACVKYALQQTSLNVPAEFAAPAPPKGETATTSTITVPPPTSK